MAWQPNYVTVEDLRDYVDVDDLDDDAQIGLAIAAASRAIDDHVNRQFGNVTDPEQRFYTARPDYKAGYWIVDVDDFQDDTDLAVEVVDAGAVTEYQLEPVNAAAKGSVWTRLAFTGDSEFQPCGAAHEVAVTALWGWTEVPTTVEQATVLQASRLLKRRHAPFGIAGSPDIGSEMRLLAKVDPDVAVALRGLRRVRAVG